MRFLNIGPGELVLIAVLALIVFGPKRLVEVLGDFGKWLRTLAKSPVWRELMRTREDLRNLPHEFMRESGLDQDIREVTRATQEALRIDELESARAAQSSPREPLSGEAAAEEEARIVPPDHSAPPKPEDPA